MIPPGASVIECPSAPISAAMAVLSVPIIGIVKKLGEAPMNVGRSPGSVSSRLTTTMADAPAAWARWPLSTKAQVPRWTIAMRPGVNPV